jgi:hypothetical protein
MHENTSGISIPPLNVEELDKFEHVQHQLSLKLSLCVDRYGRISDQFKTEALLRAYVVKFLEMYIQAHVEHVQRLPEWIAKLKLDSVQWTMKCIENYTGMTKQEISVYRKMLSQTLDEHLLLTYQNSSNPLLAMLAGTNLVPQERQTTLTGKQASSFALAGIDLYSDAPLIAMVRERNGHASQQYPQVNPITTAPTTSVGEQLKALLLEARLRPEDIAEEIGIQPRNVYRHLSSETFPTISNVGKYESALSKHLKRTIKLPTPASKTSQRQ